MKVAAVVHQPDARRFVLPTDSGPAVIDYRPEGDCLVAFHTGVPAEQRGRGLAEELTLALLAHCREQGLRLVPECSYTAAFIRRFPDRIAGVVIAEESG